MVMRLKSLCNWSRGGYAQNDETRLLSFLQIILRLHKKHNSVEKTQCRGNKKAHLSHLLQSGEQMNSSINFELHGRIQKISPENRKSIEKKLK